VAIPVGRIGSGAGLPRLVGALAQRLAAEGDRRLLWLPVIFGAGIALYFALTFERRWGLPSWPQSPAWALSFCCVGMRFGVKQRLPSRPWRRALR